MVRAGADVDLGGLVTCPGSGVLDVEADVDRAIEARCERESGEAERGVGEAVAKWDLRRDAELVEVAIAAVDALALDRAVGGRAGGAAAGDDRAAAVAVQPLGVTSSRRARIQRAGRLVVAPDRVRGVLRPRHRAVTARVGEAEQQPRRRGAALLAG